MDTLGFTSLHNDTHSYFYLGDTLQHKTAFALSANSKNLYLNSSLLNPKPRTSPEIITAYFASDLSFPLSADDYPV